MPKYLLYISVLFTLLGCTEKLDTKPDQSKTVPQSIADFQALLDNNDIINAFIPVYGEAAADNYYITDARFNALPTNGMRQGYIWGDKIFTVNDLISDWSGNYIRINLCNLVLNGMNEISEGVGTSAYNNLKGSALFFRGMSFYLLSGIFCKPYDSTTATSDLGIPLRLSSDVKKIYQRASLKETYDRILSDLEDAIPLLPRQPLNKMRPSQVSAYALLARIYLGLGNYADAGKYADSSLAIYNELLDYNTVSDEGNLPFEKFNSDIILYATLSSYALLSMNSSYIDTVLYKQFEENDLRKSLFFRIGGAGQILFKGTYSGDVYAQFGGITVAEVLLTRAECNVREGDVSAAMSDLNTLLRKRWKSGTYIDQELGDAQVALKKILDERRKELIFRGLRWFDLRRLNKDARFAKKLTRKINGSIYELLPNSPRYVLPIPDEEIALSGIQQNVR
jgi:tetratricopeptide (TPR) repeat protein